MISGYLFLSSVRFYSELLKKKIVKKVVENIDFICLCEWEFWVGSGKYYFKVIKLILWENMYLFDYLKFLIKKRYKLFYGIRLMF